MNTEVSESGQSFFEEFLDDYFAECDEHLTSVRRALMALEAYIGKPAADHTLLDDLFRSLHTIKGLSGMVGLSAAEQLVHHMESPLRALRQGEAAITTQAIDAFISGTKMLERVIAAHRTHQPTPNIHPVVIQLMNITGDADHASADQAPNTPQARAVPPTPEPQVPPDTDTQIHQPLERARQNGVPVWRFEFTPSEMLTQRGINVDAVRNRLQDAGQLIQAVPRITENSSIIFEFLVASTVDPSIFATWHDDGLTYVLYQPVIKSAPSDTSRPPEQPAIEPPLSLAPSSIVRVDLARLDELMRLVGEMVISRARLDDTLTRATINPTAGTWESLREVNLALERQLRDLREGVMRVRMIPIGEVFERMRFVVRDLAHESQKLVKLTLDGGETEIDKLVVERMTDPLLHLVRNAISHGLELPDERETRGKPREGTLRLSAQTAGDTVIIQVEDDGRGVDIDQVTKRARAMGLLADNQTADGESLLNVLCEPGFSTRDAADRASGRGIGMSVVRDTLQALGGALTLATQSGQGTRFTIELPLTLAIADALILTVGDHIFALPQSSVHEIFQLAPAAITAFESNEITAYRGGVLPLLRLRRIFGLPAERETSMYVLVIGSNTSMIGLIADHIIGQREIVVRAITDPLVHVAGIAGATELGDGRVVLILDAGSLSRMKHSA